MKTKRKRKSEREAEKASLFSRFLQYTDISLCAFGDYKIEIEKSGCGSEKSLIAYGASGIRTLKKHTVALDYGKECLVIRGERLDCHAYADGAMNVRGIITSLIFSKSEEYRDEDS